MNERYFDPSYNKLSGLESIKIMSNIMADILSFTTEFNALDPCKMCKQKRKHQAYFYTLLTFVPVTTRDSMSLKIAHKTLRLMSLGERRRESSRVVMIIM